MKKETKKYIEFLEKNSVSVNYNEQDGSVELECYTDAGGDMLIYLDELTPESLKTYLDNFDIDEEVAIWWPNGQKGTGVPFDNMRDHYEDISEWLMYMKKIADNMDNEEQIEIEYQSPSDELRGFIRTYGAKQFAEAMDYLAGQENKSISADLVMALRNYAKEYIGF